MYCFIIPAQALSSCSLLHQQIDCIILTLSPAMTPCCLSTAITWIGPLKRRGEEPRSRPIKTIASVGHDAESRDCESHFDLCSTKWVQGEAPQIQKVLSGPTAAGTLLNTWLGPTGKKLVNVFTRRWIWEIIHCRDWSLGRSVRELRESTGSALISKAWCGLFSTSLHWHKGANFSCAFSANNLFESMMNEAE